MVAQITAYIVGIADEVAVHVTRAAGLVSDGMGWSELDDGRWAFQRWPGTPMIFPFPTRLVQAWWRRTGSWDATEGASMGLKFARAHRMVRGVLENKEFERPHALHEVTDSGETMVGDPIVFRERLFGRLVWKGWSL